MVTSQVPQLTSQDGPDSKVITWFLPGGVGKLVVFESLIFAHLRTLLASLLSDALGVTAV